MFKGRILNAKYFLIPVVWCLLPWFFYLVKTYHNFDHADPFWGIAMPFAMLSWLPGILWPNQTEIITTLIASVCNCAMGLCLIFWLMSRHNIAKHEK